MRTYMKNARNVMDAALETTVKIGAAEATVVTVGIDLGQPEGGKLENINVVVEVEALPSLVDAKTVIVTIEDSADNVTYALLADAPTRTITGAGGAGAAATEFRFRPPLLTRQYIRAKAVTLAAAGDNTAKAMTMSVLV